MRWIQGFINPGISYLPRPEAEVNIVGLAQCKLLECFITFIVLYSIIKPYNYFFVINRHIPWQVFILNGIWSILTVCEIPAKFLNLPANRFLRPLQWCHTNRKWHRSCTNTAEHKYEFVHIESVQVFHDI